MSEYGDSSFREKPDISSAFIRQIDRTNQAANIAQSIYEAAVQQLFAMLPISWVEWVEAQVNVYSVTELTLFYRKNSGVRMGNRNNPVLYNERIPVKRLDDGRIDWSDENILSPFLKEATTTDYHKMFKVTMAAAQYAGITWTQEYTFVDGGDTLEHIEERRKTPFRKPRVDEDE